MKYIHKNNKYSFISADEGIITREIDEVAIAFDKETWTLHKHGRKEYVEKWFNKTIKIFKKAGFIDMANNMVMISGKFPVEELNRCLDTTGYIQIMCKKLKLKV